MNKFEYDISTLIECIEERPCLWDQFRDDYKDTIMKKKAWNEVFQYLENDFEQLDRGEQKRIGDAIKSKWQNIRDAFVRSLRQRSDHGPHRKYVYYNDLKFLLKILQKEDATPNFVDTECKQESDNNSMDTPTTSRDLVSQTPITWSNIKRKRFDNLEQDYIESPRVDSQLLGEDEAFFFSLIPTIKRMSEDEKLEFRMGVLQVIKNVKKKRNEVTIEYVAAPNF